jgi:lysophospholipase L1-like esterase
MIRIALLLILVIVAWAYGLAVGHYHLPPFTQIQLAFRAIRDWGSESPQNWAYKSIYEMRAPILSAFPPKAQIAMVGDSLTNLAEWSGIFPDADIANYGISGDTVDGVFARVPDILRGGSKKIFLMIGINDLLAGNSVSSIMPKYRKLVEVLGQSGAHVFVQSTLCTSDDVYLNPRVLELNAVLRTFCTTNASRCTFIDIAVSQCPKDHLDNGMTVDGLHLTPLGYRQWRDTIAQYVRAK